MPFQLPENLDTLSVEELALLTDAGLDALRALGLTADSDEETVVEGERIVEALNTIRARKATLDADAARKGRAANVLQALETPTEPEPPAEPDAPAEPAPATPEATEVIETTATEVPTPATEAPVPDLVPASASPARRAAANAAPIPVPTRPRAVATLTAAADVPGFATGSKLDGLDAVCAAVINRMRGFPTVRVGGADGIRHRYGAAMIELGGFDDLSQKGNPDDLALLAAAGNEHRLPGGSLTAAGSGWCAPSETLYDLCQYESVDGIVDVPEIQVSRGGIRWTSGPDFTDIYAACGFFLTEAEAIAGTAQKDCCMVECPPFEEIRLDAIGLCITAPLLTMAAYPELVRRFMEGALVAQQHKVNKYVLDTMSAAAGAATVSANPTIGQALQTLEMQAIGMRYRYRMARSATIEVIAPFWLLAVIRADWGLRQWPQETTDAAINAWFSARGLRVQWVYDWQDLVVNGCDVDVPATVDVLMYPAGSWVRGRLDVINIDAVYDSTNLANNIFTSLFVEEGILAVQRCLHTCKITLNTCAQGLAGGVIAGCLTFPSPAGP